MLNCMKRFSTLQASCVVLNDYTQLAGKSYNYDFINFFDFPSSKFSSVQ